MITLTDHGVKLVQLTEDKIELVRQWRNSDKIKKYMEYRDYITPEMQQKWFDKISNTTKDFLILHDSILVLVMVIVYKNIQLKKPLYNALIFICKHSMNIFLFHTFIFSH